MKIACFLYIGFIVTTVTLAQTNKIVFVCEHGSAKSVIAATYFNELAKKKNIPWVAVARGTNPDAQISPKTKNLLALENILDTTFVPQKISQKDVDAARQIILFFPLPDSINAKDKTRDWLGVQALNDNFQKLKDDIVTRLIPLVDSLAKQ
jgi:arsenate reductase